MTCWLARFLLPLDGDLLPWAVRRVEAHVQVCPECAARQRSHRQSLERVRDGLPVPEPERDLALAARRQLEAEAHPAPSAAAWPRWAAAAVVILAVGVSLWRYGTTAPGAPLTEPTLPVAQVAESGVSTEAQVGRRWLRERLDLRQRRGTVSPLPTVQSMGYPHGTQVTVRVPESAVTVVWVVPDEET